MSSSSVSPSFLRTSRAVTDTSGASHAGSARARAAGLLLASVLVPSWISFPAAPLAGQDHREVGSVPVSGAIIPSHLVGLEAAHADYLRGWSQGGVSSVLGYLAPGARALTRSGVVEAGDLRDLLAGVIARVRVLEASIFMVDVADGWVSLGTLLEMEMDRHEDAGSSLGSSITVWERGPDDRWRVVFLGALWIRAEGESVVEAHRRVGRSTPPRAGGAGGEEGTIVLAQRARGHRW